MTVELGTAARGHPGALHAVTLALPASGGTADRIDPIALGGRHGCLFVGGDLVLATVGVAESLALPRGLADRTRVAEVRDRVALLNCRDEVRRPGTGVLALGALPFDPDAPATLVIPRLTYGRGADGGEWVTVVGPGADPHLSPPVPPGGPTAARWRRHLVSTTDRAGADGPPLGAPGRPPGGRAGGRAGVRLTASPTEAGYEAAVAAAVRQMAAPGLQKVVLARCLDATFDRPPDPLAVLGRLMAQEPSCTVFAMPVGAARFLGASPELLVSRRDRAVVSQPLAGTIGLGGGPGNQQAAASLLASGKDRREHRFVVEHIARALAPRCESLTVPEEPSVVVLRSVAHLQTRLSGVLTDRGGPAGLPSALQLLAALHPTPAVGGTPTAGALAVIAELEIENRGPWAGAVGWTSADGDGDWYLGIRSALLAGASARLMAGAGIVGGSVPAAELSETTIKLRPVLDALAPGSGGLLHDRPR